MSSGFKRPLLVLLLALVLLVTACADAPPQGPKVLRAESYFADLEQTTIAVRVYEIPTGAAVGPILLRDPEGGVIEAGDLSTSTRQSGRRLSTGPVSVSVGVNARPRTGAIRTGGPDLQTRQVSGAFALPDPVAYRLAPEGWRIEVHYSDVTGAARVYELVPPLPG